VSWLYILGSVHEAETLQNDFGEGLYLGCTKCFWEQFSRYLIQSQRRSCAKNSYLHQLKTRSPFIAENEPIVQRCLDGVSVLTMAIPVR